MAMAITAITWRRPRRSYCTHVQTLSRFRALG